MPEPAAAAYTQPDTGRDTDVVLEVENLRTYFRTAGGLARAVDGVSFTIRRGETFALVGESGCGKSVTALSVMQLVPQPAGYHPGGSIRLNGRDILRLPEAERRSLRGNDVAMVFQEPMTSLNPVFTVGEQIAETVRLHQRASHEQAKRRAIEMLDLVRMPDPSARYSEYPHQLSGGQKQRAMIAMALSCKPSLLVADEPTTALDVTIQAQILELMRELQREVGMSILLITHDLGVVCETADRIGVMYAGQIVELADRDTLFAAPRHPYTVRLFDSLPDVTKRGRELAAIPGLVPAATNFPDTCRFAGRCEWAFGPCRERMPDLLDAPDGTAGQQVRCFAWDERVEEQRPAITRSEPPEREAVADKAADAKPLLAVKNLKLAFTVRLAQKALAPANIAVGAASYVVSGLAAAVFTLAMLFGGQGGMAVLGLLTTAAAGVGLTLHSRGHRARQRYGAGFHIGALFAGAIALSAMDGAAMTATLLLMAAQAIVLYRYVAPVRAALHAVDGIDLTLAEGRTVALVGESGCGKTTAGKAMLHLLQPTGGEVSWQGERITESFADMTTLVERTPLALLMALLAVAGAAAALTGGGGPAVFGLLLVTGVLAAIGAGTRLGGRPRVFALGGIALLLWLQATQTLVTASTIGLVGNVDGLRPGNDCENRLFLNDRTGRFTEAPLRLPAHQSNTTDLVLADVDGDLDLDLVCANARGNCPGTQNRLYRNDGTGTFTDVTAGNMPVDSDSPLAVAVGDVDGDGDLDLVWANTFAQNRLYLNDGAGAFVDATAANLPVDRNNTADVVLADLDGDGDLDVIFGNAGASYFGIVETNRVLQNDGSGRFIDVTATHYPGDRDETSAVAAGDVDGDGDADLVCGNTNSSPYAYRGAQDRLYLNDGTGRFTDATGQLPALFNHSSELALEDMDLDGDLDLLASRQTFLVNDGAGNFTDATTARLPSNMAGRDTLAVGDIDEDGDLDVFFTPPKMIFENRARHLHAPFLALTGLPYLLDLYANPGYGVVGHQALVFLSGQSARIPVPPFGVVGVDPTATVVLPPVSLPASPGTASVQLMMPASPSVIGLDLYSQALLIPSRGVPVLTNLNQDQVR